jgi:hypothetical protein
MKSRRLLLITGMLVFAATAGNRILASQSVVEPHTEADVIAADYDWLAAELRGNLAALSARLMPTYRDVTLNGKVYTREDLPARVRIDRFALCQAC